MRHKPQVVFDKQIAGLLVALLQTLQQGGFFFGGKRLRKASVRALYPQNEKEQGAAEGEQGGKQHNRHLISVMIPIPYAAGGLSYAATDTVFRKNGG